MNLEQYFQKFRKNVVGIDQIFPTPFGNKKMVYADWTASGRLYRPIEEKILNDFGPFVANTHTETTFSGSAMTLAYHEAKKIIKNHVNASDEDVLITEGTGMTGVINKFQRILGLRIPENLKEFTSAIPEDKKPVVFITHMEHHSNQTSWLETIADVEIIPYNNTGLVDIDGLRDLLKKYKNKTLKIASVTACSNVTGIQPDYFKIAKIMHQNKGVCFVDFACSAPYVKVDMHPEDKEAYLDAIFFSPHKFLGGPGTSGVLIFNKDLYHNMVPDNPGGGTVNWTNPWGEHSYLYDIELREDGGTPGFLQTVRIALAIQLKDEMGVENIHNREEEINKNVFKKLKSIDNLVLLAQQHEDRLGVFSFYINDLHFNLGVKILNDRFGIQTRGGCSCAGTYGHFLLHVDQQESHNLIEKIADGCMLDKPGWIRMSIHPTTTDEEVDFICKSIKDLAENFKDWEKDYSYDKTTNEFVYKGFEYGEKELVSKWFKN
ncbi:MAG: aminotransferase class V-fold PLP-dependent enzyme [Flavobacteriaceae bacterium]|nr:aminotransferase class V-fold PLP-dependent enzyme [Flavobacteriaceae bacterium]